MVKQFDIVICGAGPAGMLAAIAAARSGRQVLLLEKMSRPGTKLLATGGGRCNLASNLNNDEIIKRFGREGRFMIPALKNFDVEALKKFFEEIGVKCHAADGMRIFPADHNATTVTDALQRELQHLKVELRCSQKVTGIIIKDSGIVGLEVNGSRLSSNRLILATGGKGYPALGSDGEVFDMVSRAGHSVTPLFPAMLPLKIKESWVKNCRADTIGKATIRINLPEAAKLQARGDLIFTADGIRGPVILDFAREITPLLEKYGEVPLLVNLTRGMNEEELRQRLEMEQRKVQLQNAASTLATFIPSPLAVELCLLVGIEPQEPLKKQPAAKRDALLKVLTWTPLTVTGHDGWNSAMVTRGGVSLKEVRPETLASRLIQGLFFCGEMLNLDGPCGGFNLHWCFASGMLAGSSAARS